MKVLGGISLGKFNWFWALALLLVATGCDRGNFEPETDPKVLESVPREAMSYLTKHTGTLCYFCGTWGWVAMELAEEQLAGKAIVVAMYGNHGFAQDFIAPHATELDKYFDIPSYPTFMSNGQEVLPGGINDDSLGQSIIDGTLLFQKELEEAGVVASGALNWTVSNNVATINARFRFFEDVKGEYYGTVWLDESGMRAYQDGYEKSDNPAHHHVMRTASTESVFGDIIADGKISKDYVVEKTWTIDFPENEWKKENITASLLIFKKEKKDFVFVNGSQTTYSE